MSNAQSHFYLCTGFHRSGTSLLAQSLAQAGMFMGNELMGATFSNPLGHVEDMPIVRLHDKLFQINGADWRYRDNGPLIKPNWLSNYLGRYISDAKLNGVLCGVKDPRAAFFLKDWQVAGEGSVRYVFVYRHWSTAVGSLFNRSARHLVNSTAPIPANIVNFDFWKHPDWAVNMWLATNKRILEFYRQHQASCLLISQEAFVEDNQSVQNAADKIDLPAAFVSNHSFNEKLMTNQAPAKLKAMCSPEKLAELECVWKELQLLADVASPKQPEFLVAKHYPTAIQLNINCDSEVVKDLPLPKFDTTCLTWQEALGFLARIPERLFEPVLVDTLLKRPFSRSEHYQTLAKIAHKNGLYLYTKLSKMRAMHVEQGTWQVSQWSLFTENEPNWFSTLDGDLPQIIPFSLRPLGEYLELDPNQTLDVVNAEWSVLQHGLESCQQDDLSEVLQNTLLYRISTSGSEYSILANIALQKGLFCHAEFALIKALRIDYNGELVLALGDLYLRQKMHIKALQCYEEANQLLPNTAAVIARMANTQFLLGDLFQAKRLLTEAQQLQPNNRVVKLCQKQLAEKRVETESELSLSKHVAAMFIMPTVEDYEQVVSLTREDKEAGELLDLYTQRCAFILRNNRQWLIRGMKNLPEVCADYMSSLIFKHWQKLWGAAVVNQILRLPDSNGIELKMPPGESKNTVAVYIELDSTNTLSLALNFIANINAPIDLIIAGPEDLKQDVVAQCSALSLSVLYQSIDAKIPWLDIHSALLVDYELVCKLHLIENTEFPNATNWCLQQLFSLLGDVETANKIISSMQTQQDIGLVVPSYHPNLAEILVSEDNLDKISSTAKQLNVELDTAFYAYPAGGMFWYRPKAVNIDYIKSLPIENTADLHKLLPAILKANHFSTQLSHML